MSIEIRPLSRCVGAEVVGLDLSRQIDDETAGQLRGALRNYHLLKIQDEDLSAADQARFAEVFGRVEIRGSYETPPEDPKTQFVSNSREDGILGDGEIAFHHDHLFYEVPLTAIVLYGIEVPPSGSDTKFRSEKAVLDRLPSALRERARSVRCLHLYDYKADYTKPQNPETATPGSPRAWQPLVWTNPDTGEEALWLSPLNAVDFEGVTRDEGRALMHELSDFAETLVDSVYVHHWRQGDLVIWDNRMLAHARVAFDATEKRTLRRTPIV